MMFKDANHFSQQAQVAPQLSHAATFAITLGEVDTD
jgi:hypothetical protein